MTGDILVDTNVLVYAYDRSEPDKQVVALESLDRLAASGTGVLATQVLSEFFNTVTRKLPSPLTIAEATRSLENFLTIWPLIEMNGRILLEAVRGVQEHQLSFWDAQIWAAARLAQVEVVWSEDFSTGSTIDGVLFVNPFSESFQLEEWV